MRSYLSPGPSEDRFRSSIAVAAPLLLLLATPVSAADLSVKAVPTHTPAFSWTGCYLGLNAGGAASGTDFKSSVDPGTHLVDPAGHATQVL